MNDPVLMRNNPKKIKSLPKLFAKKIQESVTRFESRAAVREDFGAPCGTLTRTALPNLSLDID